MTTKATAKKTAKKAPITERLKGGYEAACVELGRTPKTLAQFVALYGDEVEARAHYSLHQVEWFLLAINEGWIPDYNNRAEEKWEPLWWLNDTDEDVPGSGFRLNGVYYDRTHSNVGARLVTRTREHALFAAKVMGPQYKNWIKILPATA